MKKITLTREQATDLIERTEEAAKAGRLLEVVMPNGKKLGDCTGAYIGQLGEALQQMGYRMRLTYEPPAGSA